MVTWIIERDVFAESNRKRMIEHFDNNNIPYHIVRIVPFIHEIEGKVPQIDGNVVVYGSIGCRNMAEKQNWLPGVWSDDTINETALIENLGDMYLNSDAKVTKMKNVPELFDGFVFMKPNTDTKEFAGTIFESEFIETWMQRQINSGYLDADIAELEVVASSVKNIGCEWRVVVVDGKISSYSCYKQHQQVLPEYWMPDAAKEFAEKVIQKYNPLPVFVLDVCETDNGYKVVEYNTFNVAGLYECDIGKIIDDVNDYVNR